MQGKVIRMVQVGPQQKDAYISVFFIIKHFFYKILGAYQ